MSRKENIEKVVSYLLEQIFFQERMVRDAKHQLEDAIADNESEMHIKFRRRTVEKRENDLTKLREMLQFMQELHFEEESK